MARRKKKRAIRIFKVIKRNIKRFTPKKARVWLRRNIKQHPIILGIFFSVWILYLLRRILSHTLAMNNLLLVSALIAFIWFIFVICANLLKDTRPTKWFYKKKFVFSMLLLLIPLGLTPLGLVLLWVGSRFKTATKITFTLIFGTLFLISYIYPALKYEKFMEKTALERIKDVVMQPKEKVFLAKMSQDILNSLELTKVKKRERTKLGPAQIASRCSASVVSIKTKDRDGRDLGMGSGFIISEDGIILTNFHVLQGAYSAETKFNDLIFENCMFIKGISELDIALLKIDAKNLPALPIGDSDNLDCGEEIVAIGNPWGLERSVSNGVVSAVRTDEDMKLIQMTAPVSFGSSGGPIINSYGEVIGIATLASFFTAQNLNFAIPINHLKQLIEQKQ